MNGEHREDGMALVLVLGLAGAIGALAAALLSHIEEGTRSARSAEDAIRMRVAIDSALDIAAARLRDPGAKPFAKTQLDLMGIAITVELENQSERIDLNAASPEEIEDWIASAIEDPPDLALELAHRVVDWRDENDLRQLEGAEIDDYRRAGLAYGPANEPFRHIFELRDVLGMTEAAFAKLQSGAAVATGNAPFQLEDDSATDAGEEIAGKIDEASPEETEDEFDEPANRDASPVEDGGNAGNEENNDEATAGPDDAGLYRVTLTAKTGGGGRQISEAVIRTETGDGSGGYELLDYQPHILAEDDP